MHPALVGDSYLAIYFTDYTVASHDSRAGRGRTRRYRCTKVGGEARRLIFLAFL